MLIILIIAPAMVLGGDLENLFNKQESKLEILRSNSRSHDEVSSDKHGITQIGLERTLCYGSCPAYSVIINSDGSFIYNGYDFVGKIGTFTGTVSKWKLRTLLQFIKDTNIVFFQNSYFRAITDKSTAYTMIQMKGRTKIIRNYANSGPTTLWAIEELIDKLLLNAKWNPSK
jgi:hypothetical protein